jgi:ABC-type phosphate/phosphonate transport system substrate-binding protein
MDIKTDLGGYAFGKDCEGIILRVYLKKVDAGVIDNWSWEALHGSGEQDVNVNKLSVIAESFSVPYWVFAAHKNTDKGVLEKIERALLKLDGKNPEHLKILKGIEMGGFAKARETEYDIVKKLQ